jgi:regulation of enolase protein 1 (concanavalin A-like superfamily)
LPKLSSEFGNDYIMDAPYLRRSAAWTLPFAFLLCTAIAPAARADTVPSPWVGRDIGSPLVSGNASFDPAGNAFTISAAGSDIWGTADQFHFVYQQVSGDVDIVARVDSILHADVWSKAGVMIRSSLTAGSAHAFALVSAQSGVAFQWRAQANGTSSNLSGGSAAAPRWVRLVRAGGRATAYASADGVAWTTIGSASIAMGTTIYVGLAVTSHNSSAATTAVVSQAALVPLSVPAPQKDADVGAPPLPGSASFRLGTYTVIGNGKDIWGTADQFNFVYQPITGDADISARVTSLRNSSSSAKAGVMIRESLASDARHVLALTYPGGGTAFQRRIDAAGFSVNTGGPAMTTPRWVRLVRSGFQFTAYASADGVNWTTIGSDTVPMADTVYVGLAVTSHNVSATTTATIDHFALTQASAPPNQLPVVSLTAPAGGATFTAPASITVGATASDPENRLSRVEFYAGSTRIGSLTAAPFQVAWSSVAAGTYSLTAVAFDLDGGSATSVPVTIDVSSAANQRPTVGLTAPSTGATFTAPATIALAASASDPDGSVAKVEFYAGSTLLGTDTTAPYTFSWTGVPAGSYTVKAIVYDNTGASTTSAPITVSVASSTTPTMVSFQKSAEHSTLVVSYRLEVFAAGANPDNATPVSALNLGKPTPDASGVITLDQTAFFNTLPPGAYIATVAAVGSSSSSPRSVPASFTR